MAMKPPELRPLTHKQKLFVQAHASGKNATQAAMQAYNLENNGTARAIGSENLTKPNIKNALIPYLIKHNITIDRALRPIDKALDAVKTNEYTGEITDDYSTQLKASDRALKLLGVTTEVAGNSLHIHLTDKTTQYNL